MHNEIAVREGNGIPRVCNRKVVGARPKNEMFIENIFTEPTLEELESLDLPNNSHVPPNRSATLVANQEEVQPDDVSSFEEFSSKPLEQLLRRCTLPRRTSSDNARLEDLEGHIKSYVDKKIGALEALIIKNHSELMKAVAAKDNKSDKDIGGISMPHIVDDEVVKGNVDLESASDQVLQQPISSMHMDFAIVDHNGNASAVDVEQRLVNGENVAKIEEPFKKDFATVHYDVDANEVEVEQRHVNEENVAKDSSKATSIPSGTETVIDAIVYKLPNESINVAPLSVISPPQLTNSEDFLSDSQLPTQLPIKESAHNFDTKTPAPRNRIPSKILQSPNVNTFGSSDKGKGKIDDDIRPYTPFEGCGITYQVSSLLMQEYSQWIQKGLLKTHANNPADDTLSTQQHIARADVVSVYERSIKDVINGFYVPAALPWHLVDEVYIPINCDEEFHWVLAVVV
ncbi:hypothetical protein MTR67_020920 [Solanum verrucosum]|uniref:Ulp1 protease family, C-terminal catalytic domain containing protein n=1 Tax=Solanum verrucosum TaxID=315347 RepID=A0AAF0TVC2_SOLVR|nr:hypothetical protein MTR67_020920 [Solanum verrucosum]